MVILGDLAAPTKSKPAETSDIGLGRCVCTGHVDAGNGLVSGSLAESNTFTRRILHVIWESFAKE